MAEIKVSNFEFYYPEAINPALKNINMVVEDGDFVVICGKSGSGKTTLLRQFKPVLAPFGKTDGEIKINGKVIGTLSQREQSEKIGYVLQNPDNQIVTDKVWHELAFGLESLGYDSSTIRLRVAEMASYFGIQRWFNKSVNELSGGQKQLLNLASIMAMHPEVLILDEPTSQLDPIAASDFIETIRKINRDLGTIIIMTEHRLEDVIPAADKVFVMDQGCIIAHGSPAEIGQKLKSDQHEMFLSMPTPMQIYAGVESVLPCPLTVREGRKWISKVVDRPDQIEIIAEKEPNKETEIAIEMKDVWFRYERTEPDVVKDLNLKVEKGIFYCIVGGNGTGKTTTISLISRLNKPYRGKVSIFNKAVQKYSGTELFDECLGVLPQNPQSLFIGKTVEYELLEALGKKKKNKTEATEPLEVINKMAAVLEIDHLMKQHPYDLSGGEQQRLALAKIMLLKPRILLLDEPTKGLDNHFKQDFGNMLKRLQQHGMTILMVSHDIEFCAQFGDRCGLFFEGSIVSSNTPRAFFSGNSFYTTAANRMTRHLFNNAITVKDVIQCYQMNR
ncbi:MAG: energy-coupling factor transport system ATP-binding protein [Eubacteriaceae bacterium]|nr:energy-coupling factor transport system ATP-binding protein [Eubacteriaceae bacterium]